MTESTLPHSRATRLLLDERGAMMLIGIFFCVLLAALLYATLGIARTVFLREALQDAADAAAFSSSLLLARGMNLIVLINLLMAALIAVLIALKLVQALFTLATLVLVGLAWPTFGATLPPAGFTTQQVSAWEKAAESARGPLYSALRGLHGTQEAISVLVPQIALLDSLVEAAQHHAPASGALALPTSFRLPIESDEFPVLCGKGSKMASELALLPLSTIPGVGELLSPVHGAAQEMGEALSGYLCGDGSAPPPSHQERIERAYPTPPGLGDSCDSSAQSGAPSSCEQSATEMREAAPDPITGDCRSLTDCSRSGPYARQARSARQQCEPTDQRRPHLWYWQKRSFEITYTVEKRGGELTWVEKKRREYPREYLETERPPCGPQGTEATDWERRTFTERGEPLPVCRKERRRGTSYFQWGIDSDALPPPEAVGQTLETEVIEVSQILGCKVWETREIELARREDLLSDGGKERSPQRVEAGFELGEEAFQIRTVSWGPTPGPGKFEGYVRLAAWSHPVEAGRLELARSLSSWGFAQAEYYFDHEGDRERPEWLWEPRWTARLRRFRLPNTEQEERETERRSAHKSRTTELNERYGGRSTPENLTDSCALFRMPGCSALQDNLKLVQELILH